MIEITNTEVVGWEHAIRGMRNPMNSWDKSDSYYCIRDSMCNDDCKFLIDGQCTDVSENDCLVIGKNDFDLMNRLVEAGSDHSKFLRMIVIYADIVAPLYWWKEFDTYKVGTVRNSCSTMHKIQAKEFTNDDFSVDKLDDESKDLMIGHIIPSLNEARDIYNNGYVHKHYRIEPNDKYYWWQMIQLLPSSYNQRSTVMLNYQVIKNMYHSRKNHKLDEWKDFCSWIESLPYSELITGGSKNGN